LIGEKRLPKASYATCLAMRLRRLPTSKNSPFYFSPAKFSLYQAANLDHGATMLVSFFLLMVRLMNKRHAKANQQYK
jgi:hypothetical protein